MTLLSRSITLTPSSSFPPSLSPKPKPPRALIFCKNDDSTKVPQRKPNQPMNSRRKKPSYGTSRRSVIKKSFTQEQVEFSAPIPSDPIVGIIGGGMSGLLCALYLEKRGVKSTVFDTVRFLWLLSFCKCCCTLFCFVFCWCWL